MQYHRYLTLFTSGERLEVPEVSMRKTCRSTIKPSSTLQFFLNLYEDNLLFNQFSVRPSIMAAQVTIYR